MTSALLAVSLLLPASVVGQQIGSADLHHFNIDGELTDGIWINVGVGSPPQAVAVLFDTGSSTLAVPPTTVSKCQTCAALGGNCQFPACGASASYSDSSCVFGAYNPAKSTTSNFLSSSAASCGSGDGGEYCPVAVAYGSGDGGSNCNQGYVGNVVNDKLQIGLLSATVSLVSITTIQSGFQEAPAAGIMGVAFSSLNSLYGNMDGSGGQTMEPDSFGTLLTTSGLANEFALCMGTATKPGHISLGGTEQAYYQGEFVTQPIVGDGGYYGIQVDYIQVAGQSLGSMTNSAQRAAFGSAGSEGNIIIDSGTPELVLPQAIYNAMTGSASCSQSSDCTVEITFASGVAISAEGLMTCESGTCQPTNWISGGYSGTILGYAVLRNYYTKFDRANMMFGFAEPTSMCSSSEIPVKHNKVPIQSEDDDNSPDGSNDDASSNDGNDDE
jgi:hypothetical protein